MPVKRSATGANARLKRVHPRRGAFQQLYAAIFVLLLQQHVKPPQAMHVLQHLFTPFVQRRAVMRNIAQGQGAVAA